MFDAKKRLVVCNERYARLYRLPPELLRTGTSHTDIIRHRIVNGILKGDLSEGLPSNSSRSWPRCRSMRSQAGSTSLPTVG